MTKDEYTLLATGEENFVFWRKLEFLQIWYGYDILSNAKQFSMLVQKQLSSLISMFGCFM